jgi:hypothetical protein
MTHDLSILILEDEDTNLGTTIDNVIRIWPNGRIEQCKSVKGALEKIERIRFDVAIIDLNMDYDDETDWSIGKGLNLRGSGGFLVYFGLQARSSKSLPPIVVLYTGKEQLKESFAPFMYLDPEASVVGRPFFIHLKDAAGESGIEGALIEQECSRYLTCSHRFYSCEDVCREIDRVIRSDYPNHANWEQIGNMMIGPDLPLRHGFPALWHLTSSLWDLDTAYTAELLARLKNLLATRNWLWNLNLIFDKDQSSGHEVIHGGDTTQSGSPQWTRLGHDVKGLPRRTRQNLLKDLGGDSWEMPPWSNQPYDSWRDQFENPFKWRWRTWFQTEVKEENQTYKTVIGTVKEALETVESPGGIVWLGAESPHSIGDPVLYMDPYLLAHEIKNIFAAEIVPRSRNKVPHAWLRVVYRTGVSREHHTLSVDLIGNQTGGFAAKLCRHVHEPSFTYRQMASRLNGWCSMWLYTHDDQGGVIGFDVSNPSRDPVREWPEQNDDVPWSEVGCLIRWQFRFAPLDIPSDGASS